MTMNEYDAMKAKELIEAARDAGDQMVILACVSVINANRMGRTSNRRDREIVREFYREIIANRD